MKLGFIISFILNIILIFLLFFKAALNEIILDVWKTWKNKKEKRKENLRKLRALLMDYSSAFVIVCVQGMGYMSARSQAELNIFKSDFDKSMDKYSSVNRALLELKPELPKQYQQRLALTLAEDAKCIGFALTKPLGDTSLIRGIENWNVNDYISSLVSTQKALTDFCSDIEKDL